MDPGTVDATETDAAAELDVKTLVEDISEMCHPRPSRSWTYWLVLFVAVLPVWSVVPLSWAFVIYALRTGKLWTFGFKGWVGFAFAVVEVSLLYTLGALY